MKNYALILAAGKGRRFGGKKQFYLLKGIPLLLHSVIAFNKSPACSEIVIVTNGNKVSMVRRLVKEHRLHKVTKVVAGGKRRIDSTYEGMKEISPPGIVAVHDAARPIIEQDMIRNGFKFAKKYRAVIFGISVEDTIKRARDSRILETIDRENLYAIQTPQFFEIGLLHQALQDALKKGEDATDESSLIERLGYSVYLFLGNKRNIKITTQEDLSLASLLLQNAERKL